MSINKNLPDSVDPKKIPEIVIDKPIHLKLSPLVDAKSMWKMYS
jgi:hypothetical protein